MLIVLFIVSCTSSLSLGNFLIKENLFQQDFSDKGGIKQEKATLSDDEDEEDEPLLKSDTEAHYECGFSSVIIFY